jgi:hypothetical protein
MTAGEIALQALARLDELTAISREKWNDPKIKKRIRLIINTANNDIKALSNPRIKP